MSSTEEEINSENNDNESSNSDLTDTDLENQILLMDSSEQAENDKSDEDEQILLTNLSNLQTEPLNDETKEISGAEPGNEESSESKIRKIIIEPLSGIEMVYIPTGSFLFGPAEELKEVSIDGYWIGKTEVTNAQFRKCVEAGLCEESLTMDIMNTETADQPANYVTYKQAQRFCKWIGGKLPTELQWEKAARGISGNIYPWGNEFPEESTIYANVPGETSDLLSVGSFPDGESPFGVLDMAGNVWEWTSTLYEPETDGSKSDSSAAEYVIRGGSASPLEAEETMFMLRTDYRGHASKPNYFLGFRCIIPDSGL